MDLAGPAFEIKSLVAQPGQRSAARRALAEERLTVQPSRGRALDMARYAVRWSPFYRDFYRRAGVGGADLSDQAVFQELPVVEKSHLRSFSEGFVVPGVPARRRLTSTTGGSTGEPLKILHDARAPVASMWWQVYGWWGIHPGDDVATVARQSRGRRQEALHRIQWWPTRHLLLDAREMTASSIARFVTEWQRVRPSLLTGYVAGLYELARFIEDQGHSFAPPRATATTAGPLSPSQRATMERVFASPVYDHYRSAEVPWIAAQCEFRRGLHVLSTYRYVEVVGADGRPVGVGESGDVLITDLANRVFPLIRYRIGDRSAWRSDSCECGRTLPTLRDIEGRTSDTLRTPDGRLVTGGLTGLFNQSPMAVSQFQIYQHADYSVSLRCVPTNAQESRQDIDFAADTLRRILGGSVPVAVELLTSIDHLGGKQQTVVSRVR